MLIAHLSDPHLRRQGQLYQGLVDSNAMFDLAIASVNALRPEPDIVIIGGDLVDEGADDEYETVRRALSQLRRPVYAIPGNHDDREGFRRCFANSSYIASEGPLHFDVGSDWPVRLLGLDVTVPGSHHGDLDDAAVRWLEHKLSQRPEQPTLILMHQPPVDSGIRYIDVYKCRGGDRLAEIVRRSHNVERVLCGHIHRYVNVRFGGALLTTAPSTTTAIALRLAEEAEPASYLEPPALLLHQWKPETGLVTHWAPVGSFPGPFPFF